MKIENGQAPCFTEICQNRKKNILDDVFLKMHSIPKEVLHIDSDHFHHFYQFYRTSQYDDRRALALYLKWLQFQSEIFQLKDFLDWFKAIQSSRFLTDFETYWSEGLGKFAYLSYQIALNQNSALENNEDAPLSAKNSTENNYLQQLEQIPAHIKPYARDILQAISPKFTYGKNIKMAAIAYSIQVGLGLTQLRQDRFVKWTESISPIIKDIANQLLEFSELQFGFMGLKNFFQSPNMAIKGEIFLIGTEASEIIQEHLESAIETGVNIWLFSVGASLSSAVAAVFTGCYNLLPFSYTHWIFRKPSYKPISTSQIQLISEANEERIQELFRIRKILKQKKEELEQSADNP